MKKMVGVLCVALLLLSSSLSVSADVGSDAGVTKRIAELEKMFKDLSAQNKDMLSQINRLEGENSSLKNQMMSSTEKTSGQIASVVTSLEQAGVPTNVKCKTPEATGIEIGVGVTAVTQGILGGDSASKKKGYSSYSADFDFSKSFGDYGAVYVGVEVGDGDGLPNTLNGAVNADAGNSSARLELTKWYYEQYLFDGAATVTFGKIGATDYIDDNAFANCEVSQFVNGTFKNALSITEPDNAMGIRLGYAATDWCEINVGAIDGNSNYNDVFADLFSFAQVAFNPNLLERAGTYRFYGWHSNNAHASLKDSGRAGKDNFGFGLSFDQEVIDNVGVFARLGWADPQVNQIELAWHGGVQVGGSYWNREADYVGLAVGQTHAGTQYEKAGNGNNHAEGQCELYYNFSVHENLQLTPHLQFIWRPNGAGEEHVAGSDNSLITVAGIRSQVTF